MGKRIAAIVLIYIVIAIAWVALGGMMSARSTDFGQRLSMKVAGLWGDVQVQQAPTITFNWYELEIVDEEVTDPVTKKVSLVKKRQQVLRSKTVPLHSSDIDVDFKLDYRQKGLLWYSTYEVNFAGDYSYVHQNAQSGFLQINFKFPTPNATYDDFKFLVNGKEGSLDEAGINTGNNTTYRTINVNLGDEVKFSLGYKSRGLDYWRYRFGNQVNRVRDFHLTMTTDFDAIDFPDGAISPSTKSKTDGGWLLDWDFKNLVSGFDIGMDMPKKLNPGPLAAKISLFAPVCLLFFFVWMFVITVLKGIDLHPMNFLFIGAGFFSFHLLFSYSVDHIPVVPAFVLSSAVSVFLVVSYLRLAVGMRFAAVEAGIAQIIYLVLFSYAHFYEGWTGLMVTIGAIITLFVLMQMTGRINWTEKFAKGQTPPAPRQEKIPVAKPVSQQKKD